MKDKMAKNTHLLKIESKKQTKQTRTDRIMDTERVLMVARRERSVGEWVKR